MKPVAKVLLFVGIPCFLLFGGALCVGACAVSNLHFSGGSLHSGVEATRVETHELAFDPGQPLRVRVDSGSIRVTCGSGARVVANLRAYGDDKQEAEQRLAAMSVELGSNSIAAREHEKHSLQLFQFGGGGEQVDLEITLPAGARLELHSGSGEVSIDGPFGDTRASSDYGDVEAGGLRGTLSAKSSSGDIRAEGVQGASLELGTDYGDIVVRRAQCERIDARTSSGEIALSDASGECRAHSDYGDIAATGVFHGLRLSTSSGSISAHARDGSRMSEGWELASDYGEVALELPAGLGFVLDATTDYGEVESDLPGALGRKQDDDTHKLRGTFGGGGPSLRLHSSSGDVAIRTR